MKKICHICNNYVSSKVHMNLIREISNLFDMKQEVFVPIRRKQDQGANNFDSADVNINYFNYKYQFLKYFPLFKVVLIFKYFYIKYKSYDFDIIFCHNFWSDGLIAFLYYLFKKTPYVLIVRNTDINTFLPKLKHYRWLMLYMVKKSNALIFINECYRIEFEKKYKYIYRQARKVEVIPNGIDDFWLENFDSNLSNLRKRENIITYVGVFNQNKNIKGVFEAAKYLFDRGIDFKLLLVGDTEKNLMELLKIDHIPDFLIVENRVNDKTKLMSFYRNSKIFIMPSFHETFGLVYIEALLQGCSIIHSKGQGIDGMLNSESIQSVNPYDSNDIAEKIEYLLNNFNNLYFGDEFYNDLIVKFKWENVSNSYLDLM